MSTTSRRQFLCDDLGQNLSPQGPEPDPTVQEHHQGERITVNFGQMGAIRPPVPVKPFVGILLSDRDALDSVEARLAEVLGPVDHRMAPIPFSFTQYYTREMGPSIKRAFLSFEGLIDGDRLPAVKIQTNNIEAEFSPGPSDRPFLRSVNIDPGYLEQSKVVLASTKNFYHRIYLGGGIFGEVTLHYTQNTFQSFPWTYPDYKTPDYHEFFTTVRRTYRAQLKHMCQNRNTDTTRTGPD